MNIVVCLGTHESRLYAVKYTHTMLTETLLFSVIQIQFQSGSDKARHALFQQMLSRWSNFSTVLILGPSFGRFVSYDLENSQLFKHWNFEKKFEKKIRKKSKIRFNISAVAPNFNDHFQSDNKRSNSKFAKNNKNLRVY